MINKHQYLRLEVIGRGGSSKVFRVIRTKDWKTFAMKRVVLSAIDDEAMRSYATEIQMLKRLSGNNSIVKLIDDELRGKGSGTLFLVRIIYPKFSGLSSLTLVSGYGVG
jgi:serine/threonine-protein kinase TTK/MPS1